MQNMYWRLTEDPNNDTKSLVNVEKADRITTISKGDNWHLAYEFIGAQGTWYALEPAKFRTEEGALACVVSFGRILSTGLRLPETMEMEAYLLHTGENK